MTIAATVAVENSQEKALPSYVFVFPSSVEALEAAIAQFESQAAFHRALCARSKQPLTKAAVSQWVRRKRGAPSNFAPDIEAISDVPCEELCRGVSWEVLRAHTPPPVYAPRLAAKPAAALTGDN